MQLAPGPARAVATEQLPDLANCAREALEQDCVPRLGWFGAERGIGTLEKVENRSDVAVGDDRLRVCRNCLPRLGADREDFAQQHLKTCQWVADRFPLQPKRGLQVETFPRKAT